MPELESDTHGMCVAGAGSAVAGDTTVGSITLPAGGPWKIFKVWSTIAQATITAGESVGGHFRLSASSGDLSPNPAPSRFPTGIIGSVLGATNPAVVCPTQMFDVEYEAAGKAVIDMIYNEPTASTVAAQVVLGMMFGKTVPDKKAIQFIDRVRVAQTSAADTAVGTITISEKATEIIGVCGILSQDNVITANEELLGFFRLASDDVKMSPAQFPFNAGFSGGLGALISVGSMAPVVFLPVIIPVTGGARIDCFVDLNTAVTNAAEVEIYIAYR
jgi:hypothetical protein